MSDANKYFGMFNEENPQPKQSVMSGIKERFKNFTPNIPKPKKQSAKNANIDEVVEEVEEDTEYFAPIGPLLGGMFGYFIANKYIKSTLKQMAVVGGCTAAGYGAQKYLENKGYIAPAKSKSTIVKTNP